MFTKVYDNRINKKMRPRYNNSRKLSWLKTIHVKNSKRFLYKNFEYNISFGYWNVCTIDNLSYKFNFYKDWKKLDEVNSKKLTFWEDENDIIYKGWNKICSINHGDDPSCWEIDYNYGYVEYDDLFTDIYLNRWEYSWLEYKTLSFTIGDGGGLTIYTFFDNWDCFMWLKNAHNSIYDTKSIFKSTNINDNKINYKKYITSKEYEKYKKYLDNWYKVAFLWNSKDISSGDISNLLDSHFRLWYSSFIATWIYAAWTMYTWYVDTWWFIKVIYKANNNKNVNFWTKLPRHWWGEDNTISCVQKVSVWKSFLKKLWLNPLKPEQDMTNYKNLNDILDDLLINNTHCNSDAREEQMIDYYKKICCRSILPWYKKDVKLDKSKIKKVILKLKPGHYPFWEERYLYEVWINWNKISADVYFKNK